MNEVTSGQAPRAGSIEARLKRMEDLFEIQQLLAKYGPSADCCDYELLDGIWAEDAVYDVGGLGEFSGREGLHDAYSSDFHQRMIATGCGHISTVPYIVLDGERASATHHAMLYEHRDGQFVLTRLSASRWLFRRFSDQWRVERRTNRLLNGDAAARVLFSHIETGPRVAVAQNK
jgi:SnoaL-like domain